MDGAAVGLPTGLVGAGATVIATAVLTAASGPTRRPLEDRAAPRLPLYDRPALTAAWPTAAGPHGRSFRAVASSAPVTAGELSTRSVGPHGGPTSPRAVAAHRLCRNEARGAPPPRPRARSTRARQVTREDGRETTVPARRSRPGLASSTTCAPGSARRHDPVARARSGPTGTAGRPPAGPPRHRTASRPRNRRRLGGKGSPSRSSLAAPAPRSRHRVQAAIRLFSHTGRGHRAARPQGHPCTRMALWIGSQAPWHQGVTGVSLEGARTLWTREAQWVVR